MRTLLLLVLAASGFTTFADRIADTKDGAGYADVNSEGRYGAYLGCMNRLRMVANGLTVNPNTWGGRMAGPDREPVLFYDAKNKGFYYVTPDAATYDVPSALFQPGNNWSPSYDMSFRRSDGESLINFYMDRDGRRPDAASITGNPDVIKEQRAANPGRSYMEVARPSSRVDDAEKVQKAFSDELLYRFPSIKKRWEYARMERIPGYDRAARFMADAKGAFCACVKTKRPEIIRAVEAAAKDIGLDEKEYEKCKDEPLVSQIFFFEFGLLPSAHADSEKAFTRMEWAGVENVVLSGDNVVACAQAQGKSFSIRTGRVQQVKCPPVTRAADCSEVGKDARSCVKSGSRIAGITGAGVVLVDKKAKRRTAISADGVQSLALSEVWLALVDAHGVSVYEIK